MTASKRGFWALVTTQALGAFTHNMLRAALLTLVAFRPVETFGLARETVAALGTLMIVAPYAVLSLPAGRLADRLPKSVLLQTIKAAELGVFALAAVGVLSAHVGVMLVTLLMAGSCAALAGPAKFGILPELVDDRDLVAANAWISATSTLAILAGLIAGNLLALTPSGLEVLAHGGVALAVLGAASSRLIPRGAPLAPTLSLAPRAFGSDFTSSFERLRAHPAIVLPVLGCSWFWFQGAVNTALVPLYVAEARGVEASVVSLMFVATSLGVTVGALAAYLLSRRPVRPRFAAIALAMTALPGVDIWLLGPISGQIDLWRATVDLMLISAGCGLFVVPLGTAVQQLTPAQERARFVGINHSVNGVAMMLAGAALLLLNLPPISVTTLFAASAVISGGIAAVTILKTWPRLQIRTQDRVPGDPA